MNTDPNSTNVIGLQIGGAVGPNDRVGMHVVMPQQPGIGVKVDPNIIALDQAVKEIAEKTPIDHPKSADIRRIVQEIQSEKDSNSKLKKMQSLVAIGSGITTIATAIAKLAHLLGL